MCYGVVFGGLSPVCLTSFSVVIVVFPDGVVMVVSCLAVLFFVSLHPISPQETRQANIMEAIMRFIFGIFHRENAFRPIST